MGGYRPEVWDAFFEEEAKKYNISPTLLKSIARQEGVAYGDFNPMGISPHGGGPTHTGSVEAGKAYADAYIAAHLSHFAEASRTGDINKFAAWYTGTPQGSPNAPRVSNDVYGTNWQEAGGINYWMNKLGQGGGGPSTGVTSASGDMDVSWTKEDPLTGQRYGVWTFPDGSKVNVTTGGKGGGRRLPDTSFTMDDFTNKGEYASVGRSKTTGVNFLEELTSPSGDKYFAVHPEKGGGSHGCIAVIDKDGNSVLFQDEIVKAYKQYGDKIKVRTHTDLLKTGDTSSTTPTVHAPLTINVNGDGHDAKAIGEHVAKAIATQKMHIQDAVARAITNLRNHEKRTAFA